jgi:hypothetical protein
MSVRKRENLTIVELPRGRRAVSAPPILVASTHTVDYCCGNCGAVLLHADVGQVHVCRLRTGENAWLATRWPLWKTSIVDLVMRASTLSRISFEGTE